MLTKEEYLEALNELSFPLEDSSCGGCKCGTSDCQDCKKALAVFALQGLIDEYFELKEKYEKAVKCYKNATSQYSKLESKYVLLKSNPPLNFEELKPTMWVWDNFTKKYLQIFRARDWLPKPYILFYKNINVDFEENRFYRYEVEDC